MLETLQAVCEKREAKGVILHSDQGSVYTSYAFQNLAEEKVNHFMHYYNHIRPFKKLNYLSPIEYRGQVA
ncbi:MULTISPECIES: IS3 family transposase [unclassified Bacillus (in: firmicutes)]|uniref:IS3 family transposase n=1 Tax=unclassified Bacillus (in: firmicutes) TaxID=185979 RepID=UPI00336540CE